MNGNVEELHKLAAEFWEWRAWHQPATSDDIPRLERPEGWEPDWSRESVESERQAVTEFERRWANIDTSRWAVQALGTSADLDHLYYAQQSTIAARALSGRIQAATPPSFDPTDFDSMPRADNYTASVAAGAAWHDAVTTRLEHVLLTWGVLAGMTAGFLALVGWRLLAKDAGSRRP